MSAHTCHAPGCRRIVEPKLFACRRHWVALPKTLRDAIWRDYRPGQEIDKRPSASYLAVQTMARAFLAFKPHNEVAALTCANLVIDSMRWRRLAISQGAGDPFRGVDHPTIRSILETVRESGEQLKIESGEQLTLAGVR